MSESVFSAHPMLEPADYGLTPDLAVSELSGDLLALYALLWHAAVATLQDGPVIRRETLGLSFAPASGREVLAELDYDLVENAGWANGELSREVARLAPLRGAVPPKRLHEAVQAIPDVLVDRGLRVRDAQALSAIAQRLPALAMCVFEAHPRSPSLLRMDELLELMASYSVGRPSTFASALERALKSGVICERDGGIDVGERGMQLIGLLGQLGGLHETFGSRACLALGEELDDVEAGAAAAGEVLRRHSQRMLNMVPPLADWLDDLKVEGETLDQAIDRASRRLPEADGWQRVDLPPGLRPAAVVADLESAMALRAELDAVFAVAEPAAWRARGSRGRAVARLAAVSELITGNTSNLLREANRNLGLRWWIDLGPAEHAIEAGELSDTTLNLPGPFADWAKRRAGFVIEVLKALG